MYQQLFIQRFCSVLFALLLALGPVLGSYAHGLPKKAVVSTKSTIIFASDESNQEDSSKENPALKQSQAFHAVITGNLQLQTPYGPANYQAAITPLAQSAIYPAAAEAYSDALLVYHQTLRHHFIAPQAP